jgi:DNA-binding beta-propeller fold protein YncE
MKPLYAALSAPSLLIVLLAGCAHATTATNSFSMATYAVSATYTIAGAGHWDLLAVDSQRHHLFVSRGDRVQVMDTVDGRLLDTLTATDGVHGIAIVPTLGRGFTTNGKANTLTEFNLDSLQRVRDIKLSGTSPDATVFDTASGRLFVFNARSNNASVVDVAKGAEITTIAFDGNPELGASDGHGHVYVNIEDKAQVVVIDTASLQVIHTWTLTGCEGPTGLALDAAHARLFSACDNGVMAVTDANTGRQIARVAIGEGPDGAGFDPQSQMAFSSNGKSGTLTVVHEDDAGQFRVVQTLATQRSARTMVIDPTSHRIYLPAADFEAQSKDSHQRPAMVDGSFRVLAVSTMGKSTH